MPYPIIYRDLANHIGRLPLGSNVADLTAHLQRYHANDADLWEGIVVNLAFDVPAGLPMEVGVNRLCEALRTLNPRFDSGLFWEWITEAL